MLPAFVEILAELPRWPVFPRMFRAGRRRAATPPRGDRLMALRDLSEIEGLLLVEPKKFGDHRGFFSETYNRARLAEAGFDGRLRPGQPLALRRAPGTVRGLHFQSPPYAQDKLVRVVRGRDPRRGRRHPRRLADLRRPCRGRALGGELAPAPGARRLRPRLRHPRARHRGDLQGDRLLRARARPRHPLVRPRPRHRLGGRPRRGAALRQGPRPAAARRDRQPLPLPTPTRSTEYAR